MASMSFALTRLASKTTLSSADFDPSSRRNFLPPNRVGLKNSSSSSTTADSEPDLSVTVNGLKMPNLFVVGSGPPGTNYTVMKRAFDEGWGGVIAKTVSLDASKVINVTPRYARLRTGSAKTDVIGWQKYIELISDRPLETMLKEFKQLKQEYTLTGSSSLPSWMNTAKPDGKSSLTALSKPVL